MTTSRMLQHMLNNGKLNELRSVLSWTGEAHLVLLSEDLHQLGVNLLCFVRHLHVAVMHQDEVLVLVAGGGRHLRPQHRQSASRYKELISGTLTLLTSTAPPPLRTPSMMGSKVLAVRNRALACSMSFFCLACRAAFRYCFFLPSRNSSCCTAGGQRKTIEYNL